MSAELTMLKELYKKANLLGDVRAEQDTAMLDAAFCETPDYRTLIESFDRSIVVGRRGTGKSALCYKLGKYWNALEKTVVIEVSPDEDQIIAIQLLLQNFGENFMHIRSGCRIIWRYALLMEIAAQLEQNNKFKMQEQAPLLQQHLRRWETYGKGISRRCNGLLRAILDSRLKPQEQIGMLAKKIEVDEVQHAISEVVKNVNFACVILMDRLDEGYSPDVYGLGLIGGMVYGAIDLKARIPNTHVTVFLRDNILRLLAKFDQDYSRNLEGQILRLHWDEHQLFNLICQRIRIVFRDEVENNQTLWNRRTSRDIQGKEGFRKCLQLTLYRPRDILVLLNDAFLMACRAERLELSNEDIEKTAKIISINRLEDLRKEYSSIFPILRETTALFSDREPEIVHSDAIALVQKIFQEDKYQPQVQQSIAILQNPQELLRELYSVGFLGVCDEAAKTFVFCHDGSNVSKDLLSSNKLLIHPCYWMALNLTSKFLNQEMAEEIYDEYSIDVLSCTPEIRKGRINKLINELDFISQGKDGQKQFEEWCCKTIRVAFAGYLRNVESHPNKASIQRRDVVGTNLGETPFWKRVYDDFHARQILFEIKNYENVGPDEFRQVLSYLKGDYGNFGFFVTRDVVNEPRKEKELPWIREMHARHGVLIVKLTGKFLCLLLEKARDPQRFDVSEKMLNKLLDTYSRLYLQTPAK